MQVPLGILALPLLVTVLVGTMAWVRARRRRAMYAAVSSFRPRPVLVAPVDALVDHLARPGRSTAPFQRTMNIVSAVPPVAAPPSPSPAVSAPAPMAPPRTTAVRAAPIPTSTPSLLLPRASVAPRPAAAVVEEPPPELGFRLERMIDVYVARALRMTGTRAAEVGAPRRRVVTPALATEIATRLATELAHELEDSAPHDLAELTQQIVAGMSAEVLHELSCMLEIEPPGPSDDDDPVIEPPVATAPPSKRLPSPTAWWFDANMRPDDESLAPLPRSRTARSSRPPSCEAKLARADTVPSRPAFDDDGDTDTTLVAPAP